MSGPTILLPFQPATMSAAQHAVRGYFRFAQDRLELIRFLEIAPRP